MSVVSVESREAHLSSLVLEAERRAAELAAQAQRDGLSLEACHKDKQLRTWEWRSKLYKRMRTGFQQARESHLSSSPWLTTCHTFTCTVPHLCVLLLRPPGGPDHGPSEREQQHHADRHLPGAAEPELHRGDQIQR